MAIIKAYSVRDDKMSIFSAPFFHENDTQAVRAIGSAVMDKQTRVHHYAEDFSLYRVGEFEEESGIITPEKDGPQFVTSAQTVKIAMMARETAMKKQAEIQMKGKK